MSLLKCDSCGCLIDTDDCPDAYFEEENAWYCYLCAPDGSDEPIAVQRYKNWTQGR
jgi:hypothetical protein